MHLFAKDKMKIELKNSTVDFYSFIQDEIRYYYFDTSLCPPPEPMINAMLGLNLLDKNSKLIMINSKPPMGLFPKIKDNFTYEIEILDKNCKIIFTKK